MIDALASSPHYLAHLKPVWEALPEEHRGTLYLGGRLCSPRCPPEARPVSIELQRPGPRVLVASDVDYRFVAASRRVILGQHGAGQSYGGDPDPGVARHTSYAGGDGQDRVDLFLVPGPQPAARTRERYPDTACAEVGCPALDSWLTRARPRRIGPVPTVAVATHWDNQLCPETTSALRHFAPALPGLADRFQVVGHSHPRAKDLAESVFVPASVPFVNYSTVLERAAVLLVDNSSIGFEAAALGIPVVWMTPPWYRDVDHGLRFGPERGLGGLGLEVRDPDDLFAAVAGSLMVGRWRAWSNPRALAGVYTYLDGSSAQRAARAIVALEEGRDPQAAPRDDREALAWR